MTYWILSSHADLWSEPVSGADPKHRQTQLLFAEKVKLLKKDGPWAYVEAIEQLQFTEQGWRGYLGWVLADDLRPVAQTVKDNLVMVVPGGCLQWRGTCLFLLLGTRLCGVAQAHGDWELLLPDGSVGWIAGDQVAPFPAVGWRASLIQLGRTFLGTPYLWGGRSPYLAQIARTGVDCSGFVNLLYRVYGTDLPRDAHDQFLYCQPCSAAELEPGDLVFTKPSTGARVDHVMLFLGEELLLEATRASGSVRTITFQEKLGIKRQEMQAGEVQISGTQAFGSYFQGRVTCGRVPRKIAEAGNFPPC